MSNITQNAKNEKQKVGVVGIPHTGTFPWQTTMSLLTLQRPQNTTIKYHLVGSCLVYDARDKIIEYAIKENADWVFFMDSDMVLPNITLARFAGLMLDDEKVEMVSGMAFKRIPPFQPCFYTKARVDKETGKPVLESPIEFPEKGLIKCEGLGMACTYIDMKAIKKIKALQEKEIEAKKARGITNPVALKVQYFFPFPGIGEDLSFCIRARQAGVKMYTDMEIDVGHVGHITVSKEHFVQARDMHKQSGSNEPLFKE